MIVLPGFCQALHSLQVSTTPLIRSNLIESTPADCKICLILGSFACHHRRCSVRSSFEMTAGFQDLRFLSEIWMLNRVQSGIFVAPEPTSAYVLRVRSTVSGPRTPRGTASPGSGSVDDRAVGSRSPCGRSSGTSGATSSKSTSLALASAEGCKTAVGRGSRGCAPFLEGAASLGSIPKRHLVGSLR